MNIVEHPTLMSKHPSDHHQKVLIEVHYAKLCNSACASSDKGRVKISMLINYLMRLLVSGIAVHIENRQTNQIVKRKWNELLRWRNSKVETKYISQI